MKFLASGVLQIKLWCSFPCGSVQHGVELGRPEHVSLVSSPIHTFNIYFKEKLLQTLKQLIGMIQKNK